MLYRKAPHRSLRCRVFKMLFGIPVVAFKNNASSISIFYYFVVVCAGLSSPGNAAKTVIVISPVAADCCVWQLSVAVVVFTLCLHSLSPPSLFFYSCIILLMLC